MSHAVVATDQHPDPVIPIEKTPFGITTGKFGMWMFLCQDCMGFVGLFAAYAGLRALADKWYDPNEVLGIWFTAAMTFVLICSSVTMVLALDACQRDDQRGLKKFLGLTIFGGLFFLGGQVYEYTHLLSESWRHPSAHNFWATFYSLTSFHGLHVLGGVIYLTCMWIGAARGKYGSRNSTPIEIVGLYWHFVDLVWILLFTFVYLISPAESAKLPVQFLATDSRTQAVTEASHAHHDQPQAAPVPHVSHKRTYIHIFIWLTVLTAIEVGVVFAHLNRTVLIILLCALAIVKAGLVAMFFMHLRFERKTLALVVMTPIVLAGILIIGLMPDSQSWFINR